MSRLMSVAFTEAAVVERRKTVTRRKGWWLDKRDRRLLTPGEHLTLCRKVMGRKAGEPLVRLVDVEVVSVTREPLYTLLLQGPLGRGDGPSVYAAQEMVREGFPGLDPAEFVRRYFTEAQGLHVMDEVTRIEWRYLDTYLSNPTREEDR